MINNPIDHFPVEPIDSERVDHDQSIRILTARILEACDELGLPGGNATVRVMERAFDNAIEERKFVDITKFKKG